MPLLDLRTAFVCLFLVVLVCVAAVARQWVFYRNRFRGLGLWLAGAVLQLPGLILIPLRGSIPDILSMTAANSFVIGGYVVMLTGLRVFFGLRGGARVDASAWVAFAAAHAWFSLAKDDLLAREMLFGAAMIFVCVRAFQIFARLDKPRRAVARGTIGTLAAICLASLARLASDLGAPARSDYLVGSVHDALYLILGLGLVAALAFATVSMVGRRVFLDQERLIEEKRLAEESLMASEEKFFKAFMASPDAIAISRLSDGRFVEVNEGFTRISGYSREEALGEPPIDLWGDPERRRELVDELSRSSFVRDRDIVFRGKSGGAIHTSYSGGLIELGGESHVVSIVHDLADRDRSAAVIRARLGLREYSVGHTTEELMVRALDEVEEMTDSRIGFYHFVDEAQGMISLQAWSTRTTSELCGIEGARRRYPIEEAGAWADALRERKAIVHNDLASLPGRRGMPEGHAEVLRELVAPTFREGRIVAILGVGNKGRDYGEEDVALVSYIADLVWSIVLQKRSDERILELNHRLEELAMTDDLTGLPNRRAFFAIAEREFQRAVRYASSLSFLMIDIDHFKLVNDDHGHDAGDAVLRAMAQTLRGSVRDVDVAARLGGEEFGVLMPDTALPEAALSAERLRAAISRTACDCRGLDLKVTVSIGAATKGAGAEDLDALMRAADVAMYRAKAAGRDRVERA